MRTFSGSAFVLAVGVLLAMVGCKCPSETSPPSACDLTKSGSLGVTIESDCHPPSCGGNSPLVNAFPINGLHARGCKNAEQEALRPLDLPPETRCYNLVTAAIAKGSLSKEAVLPLAYGAVNKNDPKAGYELVVQDPSDIVICY